MLYTSESLEAVIGHLSSLPTIGRKTAQRLALYLMKQPRENIAALSQALLDMKDKTKYCSICCNITEVDPCPVCTSEKRDKKIICVVAEPSDVISIEKTNDFHGLYHVLGGTIDALGGVGPEDINVKELISRLVDETIKEIIIALNPNIEGDMTTLYLSKLIRPLEIKVTRIARGIPLGSSLEFVDEATMSRAIEERVIVQ